MDNKSLRIGFIGAGRAANALAMGLQDSGYRVTSAASRTMSSAQALAQRIEGCAALEKPQDVADDCDLVFLTVPDNAIEAVARDVRWRSGISVVHCSGAESASILDQAQWQGALTGSFHPMQTFPSDAKASFSGVAFAVEGLSPLLDTLKEMACDLGGWPVEIRPEHRALYHLSGFLSCGLVTSLVDQATQLWKAMGYTKEQGLEVLLPLLKSTMESLETRGIDMALTGPISRGDVGTVKRHLDALDRYAPSLVPLYCNLALGAVTISRNKGSIDQSVETELTNLLKDQLLETARYS